jgi:hypothetical protein
MAALQPGHRVKDMLTLRYPKSVRRSNIALAPERQEANVDLTRGRKAVNTSH